MKKLFKPITAILLFAILSILTLTGCGSKAKVDLTEVIHVDVKGANGYGTASDWMDEEALLALVQTDKTDDESLLSALENLALLEEIECTLDKTSGLSNGDKITVTVTYPDTLEDSLNASISPKSGSSWTVEVSSLEELRVFDIFQDITVSFSGFNGYGEAHAEVMGGLPVECTLSPKNGLSNGDKVTVTLTGPNGSDLIAYCTSDGFVPATESKEFTVIDLIDAPQVDLFEDIDITMEGRSPYISLSIHGKYWDKVVKYQLDEPSHDGALKIGDTVTIRACSWNDNRTLEEQCLVMLESLPITDTYTFTIPEETEYYITDAEQLTQEILDQAISEAKDQFDSQGKADDLSIQGSRYYRYYLQTAKRPDEHYDGFCYLYIIHEVDYTKGGESGTHYSVIRYRDAFLDTNGTFRFEDAEALYGWEWDDTGIADLYDFENEYITSAAADYKCETGN